MLTAALTSSAESGNGRLASWLDQEPTRPRVRGRHHRASGTSAGLRFAFYGRTSTGRFQDPSSSQQWQRDCATRVIDGRGEIVAEFFDVGYSRALPWQHRPQAAALLRAASDPNRGFDAVVIGEFERPSPHARHEASSPN